MSFSEIIEVLAFLGSIGDYSYIDRLGNAIDEITFMEAIKDSIRAYYTNCLEAPKCVEYDREKKLGVRCPDLKPDQLEKIINGILANVSKVSRAEIIKLARELALKAYARIPIMREQYRCTPSEG
ncbi:MAG: hypothetical protein ABWW65_04765 [Thermoprotei archaeon]